MTALCRYFGKLSRITKRKRVRSFDKLRMNHTDDESSNAAWYKKYLHSFLSIFQPNQLTQPSQLNLIALIGCTRRTINEGIKSTSVDTSNVPIPTAVTCHHKIFTAALSM